MKPETMQRLIARGAMLGVAPTARWAWMVPSDPAGRIFAGLSRLARRMGPDITVQRNAPTGDLALVLVRAPQETSAAARVELEDELIVLVERVGWTFNPLAFSRLRVAAMTQKLHPPTRRLAELMARVAVLDLG